QQDGLRGSIGSFPGVEKTVAVHELADERTVNLRIGPREEGAQPDELGPVVLGRILVRDGPEADRRREMLRRPVAIDRRGRLHSAGDDECDGREQSRPACRPPGGWHGEAPLRADGAWMQAWQPRWSVR